MTQVIIDESVRNFVACFSVAISNRHLKLLLFSIFVLMMIKKLNSNLQYQNNYRDG